MKVAITPARVTGVVLSTEERTINRKSDGQQFTFRTASVLVSNKGITDVDFGADDALPATGELVDYLVEAGAYGGDPKFRFNSEFDAGVSAPAKTGARTL